MQVKIPEPTRRNRPPDLWNKPAEPLSGTCALLTSTMATITDPARELADVADKLSVGSGLKGEDYLAERFGVAPWSTDFVKILACILERADLVARIIARSELDPGDKAIAATHLVSFKSAFTGVMLRKVWHESGAGITIVTQHGGPIRFMSATIKNHIKYPQLTEEEVAELVNHIDRYLSALGENDQELPFVKQAITDGLTAFRFQLVKIGWMGSGYALAAFRQVNTVYEMSERMHQLEGTAERPALLDGLANIVASFRSKVDSAQGWYDTGETVWKAYQLISSTIPPLMLTGAIPALPSP